MIRLTTFLIGALYVVLSVYGEPITPVDEAQRAEACSGESCGPDPANDGNAGLLALGDHAGAIDRALSASAAPGAASDRQKGLALWGDAVAGPADIGLVGAASAATAGGDETSSEPKPESAVTLVRVTGDSVNLRTGPSPRHDVVGQADRGMEVEILERQGKWVRIGIPETSQVNWIFGRFLAPIGQEQ